MFLNEGIEDSAYYVDIRELNNIYDEDELIDALFDDYRLDAEHFSKYIVKVYAPNNRTIEKLEDALILYGANKYYVNDVINRNNIKENKKITYKNMKRGLNENKLMRRRLHESFRDTRAINYVVNMFGDFDPIFEAEDSTKDKKDCTCRYKGKLISKMDKVAKRKAKDDVKVEISDLKKSIRAAKKVGKSTKSMEAKLEKLQNVLDCLMGKCEKNVNESVISSFRKRGRLFESDENQDADNIDDVQDDTKNDDTTDDVQDTADNTADDKDEYEDVEMKAVVLTVLNKNVNIVKDAMIESGVNEDDINVTEIDDDASDDDKVDIRVEVNSIDALTKYLESVGINLEDELGGEVISSDEDNNEDEDNKSTDGDSDGDSDEFNDEDFDDLFSE